MCMLLQPGSNLRISISSLKLTAQQNNIPGTRIYAVGDSKDCLCTAKHSLNLWWQQELVLLAVYDEKRDFV